MLCRADWTFISNPKTMLFDFALLSFRELRFHNMNVHAFKNMLRRNLCDGNCDDFMCSPVGEICWGLEITFICERQSTE
jgi:hypothetical protein